MIKSVLFSFATLTTYLRIVSVQGYCHVELRSWGLLDNTYSGYIKLNHVTVLNLPPGGAHVGWWLATLDPVLCVLYNVEQFVVFNTARANAMVEYIANPSNNTMILGVTIDTADANKATFAPAMADFLNIDTSGLVFRGKFVFCSVKGAHGKAKWKHRPEGGDNLIARYVVEGPRKRFGVAARKAPTADPRLTVDSGSILECVTFCLTQGFTASTWHSSTGKCGLFKEYNLELISNETSKFVDLVTDLWFIEI